MSETEKTLIPDFFSWCATMGHEVPEPPTNESGSGRRAAVRSHAYPELYGRGQYPKGYFMPTAADNLVYNKDKE